ncbi:MAG TPA: helix-turn-helix domain-containing protein [Candidatus Hungatella pullicola]|nr:helix-turn-helix domain-containing protein [Candidatus Hungatella pullicola]
MDDGLAKKLIDKLSDLTEYNISIIDENGKVVASKMEEHIGAFHETAFGIIKGKADSITVDISDPDTGVKEGIYMALYVNKCKTGVVGINGDPKKIRSVAGIIRLSIETMLEFELYRNNNMRKFTVKERFMRTLFYSDDFERQDLEQYFTELKLNQHLVRIPVLIQISDSSTHAVPITKQLEGSSLFSKEDFIGITNDGTIVLFKSISCHITTVMQDYKYILGEYLTCFFNYARVCGLSYSLYIGPMENDIMQYRQAYLYCRWLQKNIGKTGTYYFYDYLVKYLESMASQQEYNAMFLYFKQGLGQKFIDNYIEIMAALIEKDYNLAKASDILHIHKNTLIYRLDKIREILNMNPLTSNSEREFMECFYFYLIRSNGI